MKQIELKIPNLGEAEDTEIIEISVSKGDKLKKNDPIVVLESEKAAMEVPSDYDGIVKDIRVKEGDSVREGAIFAIIEVEEEVVEEEALEEDIKKEVSEETRVIPTAQESQLTYKDNKSLIDLEGINAGPAVRKIARELDIDLKKIIGSGKNNMITKDDLKDFIHSKKLNSSHSYVELSVLEGFGKFKIENQSKIKKFGAKNLTESWVTIPHVSHFEEADITKIEFQRKELNNISNVKITPLAYILKATSIALKEYPLMNSALVGEGKIMLRDYINIGIAVNTEKGLVVPVIKDVDVLKIGEIAKKIKELSALAKENKLLEKDISGATFTVSSLGNIGGTGFSPIINPPEVGIIGISRSKEVLMIEDDQVIRRLTLPFSLSYDHRVINGVDAGNFMSHIKMTLQKGL